MEICKYNDEYECVNQRADDQPRNELTKSAAGVVYNHAHEQIIEGIPQLCDKEHGTDKSRCDFDNIGKINHGKRGNHAINHVFTKGTKSK